MWDGTRDLSMGLKIKLGYLATGYKGSVSDYKSKAGQITGNPVYKPPSMLVTDPSVSLSLILLQVASSTFREQKRSDRMLSALFNSWNPLNPPPKQHVS